jgi:hypothetical protein
MSFNPVRVQGWFRCCISPRHESFDRLAKIRVQTDKRRPQPISAAACCLRRDALNLHIGTKGRTVEMQPEASVRARGDGFGRMQQHAGNADIEDPNIHACRNRRQLSTRVVPRESPPFFHLSSLLQVRAAMAFGGTADGLRNREAQI